ncbi:cyclodeaminase/cyclohydrolase family protein [Halomarina ordinaria]|uniref:Cyclodeaminase/cyclohydrolase family protein n=1 Tax=Halomarina ordinaria TaxID=3033939 RepID=A0ABD5UG15_9EURY|nr:cyclodeaminase/cyclohydrolase family protein [Halomarina sp. PSRA2]
MGYDDRSIGGFLDLVASHRVTPAGGTGAAVGGAIGTALCEMVCLHTIGRDEYADVRDEMTALRTELETQREALLTLADRDAAVVDALLDADGDADRTAAAKRATGVPLAIGEACLTVLERATVLTKKGNRNAVPDAVTGAYLVHGALRASVFTVRTNTARLSDSAFAEEMETRAADIERSAERELDRLLANAEADRE